MDTQPTPITCPQCSRVETMDVPLKVNTRLDPGARQGLLSGSLFAFVCSGCGYTAEVLPRGFLYQDPDNTLLLYLTPAAGTPPGGRLPAQFADHRIRVVTGRVAAAEQVLIAEAGLDDRHVMLLKIRMKQDHAVFAGLLGERTEVALSQPDGSVAAVAMGQLEAVAAEHALPADTGTDWQRIDTAWARDWAAKNPGQRSGTWWNRW